MTSYLKQAPVGFEGSVSRPDYTQVEPAMLVAVSSVYAPKYGLPMVLVNGGMSQWGAGNVAADFAGVLVRSVPQIGGLAADDTALDGATPWPSQVQNLLKKGYCTVKCGAGTPARGGPVYVAVDTNGGATIGDFQATANGAHNVALTGVVWAADGKDANNIAEIRVDTPAK